MILYRISILFLFIIFFGCSGDSLSFTYSKKAIVPEISSDIADMTEGIPTMADITLKFNSDMDKKSVEGALSFRRAGDFSFLNYSLKWDSSSQLTLLVNEDLKEFERYVIEIKNECKNIYNYKPRDNYALRFKTGSNDKTPPKLLYSDPTNDAKDI